MNREVVISDAHAHISNKGIGPHEYAKRFKGSNGWFIALASLPPYHYGLGSSLYDLIKSFDIHIELCNIIRSYGIKVSCILGLHPAYIDRIIKEYQSRHEKVLEIVNKGIETIERYIKEGRADGVGEVGRPHYKTIPEVFSLCDYIIIKALEIVNDYDVVLHLHLEDRGILTVLSIGELSEKLLSKSRKRRVVFHHASLRTSKNAFNYGFSSTIIGKYPLLKKLFDEHKELTNSVMIESDYIDDLRRPGVVMYPWEIVKEATKLLSESIHYYDLLEKVFIDNIVKVYDVEYPP